MKNNEDNNRYLNAFLLLAFIIVAVIFTSQIWLINGHDRKTTSRFKQSNENNIVPSDIVESTPSDSIPEEIINPAQLPNPTAVLWLTKKFDHRPLSRDVTKVSQLDLPDILQRYNSAETLGGKRGLTWALGYIGGEEAVSTLIAALANDYQNAMLSRETENVLLETVLSLGFAATENNQAYNFILKGTEPQYWQDAKTWQSPRGEYSINLLVCYSLQALGIAGRNDTEEVLNNYKKKDKLYLYDFGSSVTEAAFYSYIIKKQGRTFFRETYSSRKKPQMFQEWANGEGKEMVEWANSTRRGPRPK